MDNEEYYDVFGEPGNGSSGRGRGASREESVFFDIPSEPVRRTPNSGRPVSSAPQGRGTVSTGRGSAFQDRSEPVRAHPRGETRPADTRQDLRHGGSASFTEISWDSFFSGEYERPRTASPASPAEPEAPAQERDPFGDDFRRYAEPAARSSAPRYNSTTRTAPAYRGNTGTPYGAENPGRGTVPQSGGTPPRRPVSPDGERKPASPGYRPPSRPKRKTRGIHPVFYIIALVLAAILFFGVSKLVGAVKARGGSPRVTPVMYVPGSAVTHDPNTPTPSSSSGGAEILVTETPSPSPEPTPTPSPTPSGPKAKQSGSLIVPADWGPAVPERRKTVFDSYFDKSLMIGNSLTEGFFMWSGMTNIRYIYNTGAVVTNVIGVLDLAPVTLNPSYYTDIYLMFGLNEVGSSVDSFISGYKKLVDYIREYQPSANIYLISVTPVTREVDEDPSEVQSMERINKFNAAIKEFCVENDCWYLDIYSMLIDSQGYLSAAYAFEGDGKHFEKSGYVAWANYMKTHYVDAGLLTE